MARCGIDLFNGWDTGNMILGKRETGGPEDLKDRVRDFRQYSVEMWDMLQDMCVMPGCWRSVVHPHYKASNFFEIAIPPCTSVDIFINTQGHKIIRNYYNSFYWLYHS